MSLPPFATAPDTLREIVADHAAARVDSFLAACVADLSRSRIQALIAAGQVTCDGVVVRGADTAVAAGERFCVVVPAPVAAAPAAQAMALDILFEDRYLLVLDKPAGLVVHPAPGSPDRTLVNALLAHCGDERAGIGGERRPGIVHRLDKDTSGVMVVAKTEIALTRLSAAFAARDLDRSYLALCWGVPAPIAGDISGAIGRDPRDRKRMAVVTRGGKAAVTTYRTEQAWYASVALLACRLQTGRTHQIRVHLAARGHPLVGDPVYLRRIPAVARGVPITLRGTLLDFPRQALHAASLGFAHPISGEPLRFERPPPADMRALLDGLGSHANGPPPGSTSS